ncbi:Hypothetical predicted protein, partial [Lynx pardinus]
NKNLSVRLLKTEDRMTWRKTYDGDIFFLFLKFLHLAPSHLDSHRHDAASHGPPQHVLDAVLLPDVAVSGP